MGKCYVKAYYDWIEQTAALEDDERGRLFIAILEYARSGTVPDLRGRESVLFPVFRVMLDREEELSTERSANGSKGGKQTQANSSKFKQSEANENDVKQNQANESNLKPTKTKTEDKDLRQKTEDKDLFPPDGGSARAKRFTPPTLAEVQSYVAERHSAVDPQEFIDFYESKGWMVGKTPMKDWKAACRNAEKWDRWQRNGNVRTAQTGRDIAAEVEDTEDWMDAYLAGGGG